MILSSTGKKTPDNQIARSRSGKMRDFPWDFPSTAPMKPDLALLVADAEIE